MYIERILIKMNRAFYTHTHTERDRQTHTHIYIYTYIYFNIRIEARLHSQRNCKIG